MKKFISILLIMPILSIGGISAMSNETIDIFVSLSGDDANNGISAPVKTFERAKELVREYNSEHNVTVHIPEGEYVIDETITLTPQDGGLNGYSVTYLGDGAVISGGERITGWSMHDEANNIYKAENVTFDFAQFYINGEKQPRAKSVPLDDLYSHRFVKAYREDTTIDGVTYPKDSVVIDPSFTGEWNNIKDIKLKVFNAWTDNLLPIESLEYIGDKAVIKLQNPASDRVFNRPHPDITGYSHEKNTDFVGWFENAYEFINEEGEWYLDKSTATLYYKAPEGFDLENAQAVAPKVETLISIEGELDNTVKNLTFEGITFTYSTWLTPNNEGVVGGQASQYVLQSDLTNVVSVYRPPSAVYVKCGENINFTSNTFTNLGSTALDYHYGTKDGTIEGNVFKSISGNGINIAKFVCDDMIDYHDPYNLTDEREICDGQIIRNNYITQIGTDYEGSVSIGCGYPRNITIEHNTISHAPYTGISVGFGWTSEDNAMRGNKILSNHIHDVSEVLCDGAAIYTLSKQPDSEMAYNYVHDFDRKAWFDYGCAGIYLDEQTAGYNMHDNAMFNCPGIWQNRTGTNTLSNNAAIYDEAIILSSGVQGEYQSILPDEELPQMPNPFVPENEKAHISAIISTNAPLAVDNDTKTAQKADKDGEFIFELPGDEFITDIVIKKQYEADGITGYDYWPDWIFAVGCEIQGSYNGTDWETIGICNTWPDNMPKPYEEVFTLETPKQYKYVRYIRTTVKDSSSYGAWLIQEDFGNRLNLAEINIYTAPFDAVTFTKKTKLTTQNAPFAIDEDTATAQTADKDTIFTFELDGKNKVTEIIIKKQFEADGETTSYWPDWIFAIGCSVQGSLDGENWVTLGECNTWPDNTGDIDEEVFNITEPLQQPYKYIRYLRTSTNTSYCTWKYESEYLNHINLAEIEVYTKSIPFPYSIASAEYTDTSTLSIQLEALTEEINGTLIAALYTVNGELKKVETIPIVSLSLTLNFPKEEGDRVSLYIWDSPNNMTPLSKPYIVE